MIITLSRDFLDFDDFLARCNRAVEELLPLSQRIGIIVGAPDKNPKPEGKDLFNAAFLLHEGEIKSISHKTLLPTYDIFDEYRYFEPNTDFNVVEFKGHKIAVTICEDIWNLNNKNPLYTINPMDELEKQHPDFILNLYASPFHSKQATDVDDNRPILILHYEKEVPTVEFDVVSLTGLESQNSANLQVNLSEVNTADVLVNYTVSGTAFGNEADYTLANGTLTISAGNTSANIVIADINDDTNEEANETIIVTLSNPIRAMLGNNITHTYTIIDNDVDPVTYISVEDTFIRNGVHSDENYGSLDYMAIKKKQEPELKFFY